MCISSYIDILKSKFIIFSAVAIPDASSWRANRIVPGRTGSDKQISCSLGMNTYFVLVFFSDFLFFFFFFFHYLFPPRSNLVPEVAPDPPFSPFVLLFLSFPLFFFVFFIPFFYKYVWNYENRIKKINQVFFFFFNC